MSERETTTNAMADEKTFTIYSSESKWIKKIKKLAQEYPDDVKISRIDYDEIDKNKEYSIEANISKKFLKINPPRKSNMTDEQKAALAARLRKSRNAGEKNEINT